MSGTPFYLKVVGLDERLRADTASPDEPATGLEENPRIIVETPRGGRYVVLVPEGMAGEYLSGLWDDDSFQTRASRTPAPSRRARSSRTPAPSRRARSSRGSDVKCFVQVEIPFEAESAEEAQRLAEAALKGRGFADFKVMGSVSADARGVCDECGAEYPDEADSVAGPFHEQHCSLYEE